MAGKSYSELLKDPRWQKKRLEIMQRDNFACCRCFDDSSTLNVHHIFYEKNKKPWEYENLCFLTLCEECHKTEHECEEQEYFLDHDLKRCGLPISWIRGLVPEFYDVFRRNETNPYVFMEMLTGIMHEFARGKIKIIDMVNFIVEARKKS